MRCSKKYRYSLSNDTSRSNHSERRYEKNSTSSDEYRRAVTAGSDMAKSASRMRSSRRESIPGLLRRKRQVFQELCEVEGGVADERCDDASPRDVQQSPHEPEQSDGDGGVVALIDVPGPEEDAVHGDAPQRSTEVVIESVGNKTALHFFPHAAGDHHHHGEDHGVR